MKNQEVISCSSSKIVEQGLCRDSFILGAFVYAVSYAIVKTVIVLVKVWM